MHMTREEEHSFLRSTNILCIVRYHQTISLLWVRSVVTLHYSINFHQYLQIHSHCPCFILNENHAPGTMDYDLCLWKCEGNKNNSMIHQSMLKFKKIYIFLLINIELTVAYKNNVKIFYNHQPN